MRDRFSIILFAVTFGLTLYACSGDDSRNNKSSSQADHPAHADMEMAAGEPSDESIYNVSSTWQDRDGNIVKLSSLQGKVQVVTMVYTYCDYACPRIVADLKRIRDGFSADVMKKTNFTIVSIDPERDTPGRLKKFATENNLNPQHWTLLHGDDGDILELAALLGFKYKRISDTDFTHSNLITILNKEGEIVYQRNKLVEQPAETIRQIEEFVKG